MGGRAMSITEASGFKGIVIPRISYGEMPDPQYGEMLLFFGDVIRRESENVDDEWICHRFGEGGDPVTLSIGDFFFYEGFPEIEVGSPEWIAWVSWIRDGFDAEDDGDYC